MRPNNKGHIWVYLLIAICLLFVAFLAIGTIKQKREQSKFENALNELSAPSSVTFKSKNCVTGNIDTHDYCIYYYTSNNSAQSALDFANSAKQSNYDVQTLKQYQAPNLYIASNNSRGVKLRISSDSSTRLSIEVFSSSVQQDFP